MNRRRRTEILIQSDHELANRFAQTIRTHYDWQDIVPPQYGLTMIKMRESAKNSLFYLGEVLVTEAKVELNDCIGIGIVIGMEAELARDLAVIDAAYQAKLPETKGWEVELLRAEKLLLENRAKEQAKLMKTKVDFQTMDIT